MFLLVGVVRFRSVLKYLNNVFAFCILCVWSIRGNTIDAHIVKKHPVSIIPVTSKSD